MYRVTEAETQLSLQRAKKPPVCWDRMNKDSPMMIKVIDCQQTKSPFGIFNKDFIYSPFFHICHRSTMDSVIHLKKEIR
jgi:hypothetical protein